MEALYETDVFAENLSARTGMRPPTLDLNIQSETVDPYAQAHAHASNNSNSNSNSSNTSSPRATSHSDANANNNTVSFRDRLSIMELHAVDQQVERYAQIGLARHSNESRGSSDGDGDDHATRTTMTMTITDEIYSTDTDAESSTSVMDGLYGVDLEMDSRGQVKETKCDIAAIMDLYKMDLHANGSSDLAHAQAECMDAFQQLYAVDTFVDRSSNNGADASEVEFVDPMTVQWMKQCLKLSIAQSAAMSVGAGDVSDLYRVDLDVDGHRNAHSQEMAAVADLLEVDREIDAVAQKGVEKYDIGDLQALYAMDMEVDRMAHYQGILCSNKPAPRRSPNNANGNSIIAKNKRSASVDAEKRFDQAQSNVENIVVGKKKDEEELLIEHLFGLPPPGQLSMEDPGDNNTNETTKLGTSVLAQQKKRGMKITSYLKSKLFSK